MAYSPKIYISAPYRLDGVRKRLKEGILAGIREVSFAPQEFGASGFVQGKTWSFERALETINQCDGALILALARWLIPDKENEVPMPGEYSHFEGALAMSSKLPTLVIGEKEMQERGILAGISEIRPIRIPINEADEWLEKNKLLSDPLFKEWSELIRDRYDVFFGYCSKADSLAKNIKGFLEDKGMKVFDWATGFLPGRTIMQEVTRAASQCRCGLFLFTADDPVESGEISTSLPRDNVLLEAGYFMRARGPSRVVIVREKGTKMPADLGGIIYLMLDDRNLWQETAEKVAQSIRSIQSA